MGLSESETVFIASFTSFISICWTELGHQIQKRCSLPEEMAEHIVSLIHSLLIIVMTGECLRKERPYFDYKQKTNMYEELCLFVSLGYFLYDTCNWEFRGDVSRIILSHHICTLFGMLQALSDKTSGAACLMCLLILEGGNPLLHNRRLIMIAGHIRSGLIYQVIECSFFIFFFLFRFVLGLRFFNFLIATKAPHYMRMTGTMMLMISIVFFKKMLEHLISKVVYVYSYLKKIRFKNKPS
ncbi:transmembrane protein 136-like [Cimex lectularius]|uniref:TLC domain-containing protein n=1 Tax=Cimex lectularius TaxID=79782 RepID=A0A8I6REQ9_CIMLE|nr:transmembrane protein 136-like [Cimex lectularius]